MDQDSNVLAFQTDHLIEVENLVASADLPWPRDAWHDEESRDVMTAVVFQFVGHTRPWSNEAHLTACSTFQS